ncbi:MAG: serine protease, partial [Bacteroidota bacterium]
PNSSSDFGRYLNDVEHGSLKSLLWQLLREDLLLRMVNHDYLRPAIVVQDGSFTLATDNPWAPILQHYRKYIERAIRSTGVFEIQQRRHKVTAGTGWVLDEDLIVTNQHVAAEFFERKGEQYHFKKGRTHVTIDFKEEFDRVHDREFRILELVHMEAPDHHLYDHRPDLAILRVEKTNEKGESLPPALPLFTGTLDKNQLICIVGFPGADYKLPQVRKKIFKNIYDVKRIQPGIIKSIRTLYDFDFKHDCATLTGNSGSPVIDLQTGTVVGIHFAGALAAFEGYAVRVDVLRAVLQRLAEQ